ncbi:MAG TPA: CoA-binding protein [Desulfobacteraceae bacterium]|nr:CoA-binding protein [Desulfobacteraceae bacterium]HPJ67289.1 CoA-binding protein [Desulfobacteraceae bacterium]HPQ29274.1 CoA-binding protein [Desulfobacteraceae bacterium]
MTENMACEVPLTNPLDDEIKDILEKNKVVAVVGLSDNPAHDSYRVADYLKNHGYTIIPVNPLKQEILGEKSYPDLTSITAHVDIVDIFRDVSAIPKIVDEAIRIKAKVVWMQLGLAHNDAADKAADAGLKAVQSKCMKIEHAKLIK